jgi:small subunit ribosomal protein S3
MCAKKVHPKIFRIKGIENWDSKGFYEKNFSQYLEEDFKIREFLENKIDRLALEKIEIERSPGKINLIIHTPRPGLIIGRGGEEVERLKEEIEKKILKEKRELKIEIREVKNPWTSATLVAKWMASQIEKRVPYRRVLKQALNRITLQKGVEGARVQVAGRLDGVEIARKEWIQKGRLPRQTLRAEIDYGQANAYCTYGVVGVKVWIYKGEKFD